MKFEALLTLQSEIRKQISISQTSATKLRLAMVIVGAQSSVSRATLQDALGDIAPFVAAFKARLDFKTFRVVRQRKSALWT